MYNFTAYSQGDLPKIANGLLELFSNDIVFAFYGKMGSGKTTFIKEICNQLGVNNVITSPTFALINEYTDRQNKKLYHFDFYRIETQEEAFDFGYEEYFFSGNKCFIEWPELIENLLPDQYVRIDIIEKDKGLRSFTFQKISS